MKTVYLLVGDECPGYRIYGVFATRELAEIGGVKLHREMWGSRAAKTPMGTEILEVAVEDGTEEDEATQGRGELN